MFWLGVTRADVVGGVVAGLIATGLLTAGSEIYRRWQFRRALRPQAGDYRARWKYTAKVEPETLVITVEKNRLIVTAKDAADPYEGKIVMNEQFLQSGRGQYWQTKTENGEKLWGTWDVQLLDAKTILVDRTHADPTEKKPIYAGFVWEKLDASPPASV